MYRPMYIAKRNVLLGNEHLSGKCHTLLYFTSMVAVVLPERCSSHHHRNHESPDDLHLRTPWVAQMCWRNEGFLRFFLLAASSRKLLPENKH